MYYNNKYLVNDDHYDETSSVVVMVIRWSKDYLQNVRIPTFKSMYEWGETLQVRAKTVPKIVPNLFDVKHEKSLNTYQQFNWKEDLACKQSS